MSVVGLSELYTPGHRLVQDVGGTMLVRYVRFCDHAVRRRFHYYPDGLKDVGVSRDTPLDDIIAIMKADSHKQMAIWKFLTAPTTKPTPAPPVMFWRDGDMPDRYRLHRILEPKAIVDASWLREPLQPCAGFHAMDLSMSEPWYLGTTYRKNEQYHAGDYTDMQARLRKNELGTRIIDEVQDILHEMFPMHFVSPYRRLQYSGFRRTPRHAHGSPQ